MGRDYANIGIAAVDVVQMSQSLTVLANGVEKQMSNRIGRAELLEGSRGPAGIGYEQKRLSIGVIDVKAELTAGVSGE